MLHPKLIYFLITKLLFVSSADLAASAHYDYRLRVLETFDEFIESISENLNESLGFELEVEKETNWLGCEKISIVDEDYFTATSETYHLTLDSRELCLEVEVLDFREDPEMDLRSEIDDYSKARELRLNYRGGDTGVFNLLADEISNEIRSESKIQLYNGRHELNGMSRRYLFERTEGGV